MKKLISLVLLSALFLSLFASASCGDNTNDSFDVSTSDAAMTDTVIEESTKIPDDLPEKDYKGRTFTVITFDQLLPDYVAETENGDVINDAVYSRNRDVSERFNVKLETMSDVSNVDVADFIAKTVLAGEDAFQLVAHHAVSTGGLAMKGVFMNWYDVPYVDFSKPWWSKSTVEDLTYGNDFALLAIGDYALSALAGAYCYFYDKPAAAEFQLDDLYSVVNDGKWTLDYVMDTVKNIYKDLNGNGERDGDDYFGLSQSIMSALNTYLWSSGGKIFEKDNNGIPTFVYKNEKINTIVEKVYELCYENDGVCTNRPKYPMSHYVAALAFKDNMSAFVAGTLDMTVNYFRDRQSEYGILPYPKLDENQKEYKTMADGYHAVLAVPKTVQDTEFVGIITEALNAESMKQVFPAYYETALKKKYSYDDESVKMLDMIVDSRVFDFGYIYDNWNGVSFYFQTLIGERKSKDFESYYAKKGPASEKYYEKLVNYFEEARNEG